MLEQAGNATSSIWSQGPARVLPSPATWPLLGSQVKALGGNVVQVMAAPGVGKTAFGLYWALGAQVKTLYMASDTDMRLFTEQMAAYATGEDRATVRQMLEGSERQRVSQAVSQAAPDLFVDPLAGPELSQIEERIVALTELWGETPQLVVLDTISDVRRAGDGYDAWRDLWLDLRSMSRHYDTTIMFMHHLKGNSAGRDGDRAPQLSDGKYGSHEFCEIVLGLHKSPPTNLDVSVLKNRGGRSGIQFQLRTDYSRLELEEASHNG